MLCFKKTITMKGRPKFNRYGTLPIREDDCSYVWNIPAAHRCNWVKHTADCTLDAYVQYAHVLFCTFNSDHTAWFAFGLFLFVLWLLYLFLVLATTADNFFCPCLSAIAKILHLSENIAGVTILAFGNGAPDIFTSLVSKGIEEEMIMFTELIGAGIFVTAVIAGSVAIFCPFRIAAKPFMRDCCFYTVSICWISYITADHIVQLWESLSLIVIYIFFIITVVAMQFMENRDLKREAGPSRALEPSTSHTEEAIWQTEPDIHLPLKPGAYSVETKLDVAIATEIANVRGRSDVNVGEYPSDDSITSDVESERPVGLFKEFLYDINPLNANEWQRSSTFIKIILAVRAPVMFLLQLLVPVVNETAVKRGWSKLLNCIQLCITPLLAMYLLDVDYVMIGKMPLMWILFSVHALAAITVFVITDSRHPPKYHNIFAFLGFLGGTLVVWIVAGEVMSVLHSIGFASGISDAMLGITLLAWGNSVGDLISNVAVARQGFPHMGYSACFGGPMFNTLLGLGLTWTIDAVQRADYQTPIRTSDMMPGCLAFLLCSLFSSVIYLIIMNFLARRSYGYLLLSIYFVFIFINFLSEVHFIHPLGTDHRNSLR